MLARLQPHLCRLVGLGVVVVGPGIVVAGPGVVVVAVVLVVDVLLESFCTFGENYQNFKKV